jgi:hypothetical protein
MKPKLALIGPLLAASLLAIGCGGKSTQEVAMPEIVSKAELEAVAQARVFFGHQSVGGNILEGVDKIAAAGGLPLRVAEINDSPPDVLPGIFHAKVGANADAGSKCEAFAAYLDRAVEVPYDVAVLKFCYVDLDDDAPPSAVAALFEQYRRTIARVRDKHPQLRLVFTTIPLEAEPAGWKTPLKRLLGRSTWTDAGNVRRDEYNERIRREFAGEIVFDIARLQSTFPDGNTTGFAYQGRRIATLAHEYTYDGGHLNDRGQQRLAAGFVAAVAAARARRETGSRAALQ